ncbi:unnamed protein product [Symbiodinium natans]|uniref:EF-hand domain-containing protein n=1 Tax=Symbiodinium natans TaxID=878477 RepID=A0A812RPY8_9DINO|nr:unnamed protein product [Symbiodinium natans]
MATLGSKSSIRCDAQTTRRLVDQEAGHVKNMDLDKLDSCGEVTLGLVATFACALLVCMVALPFFDVVTMGWVKTWERHVGYVSMSDFKAFHVFGENQFDGDANKAYNAMDKSQDGYVDLTEFRDFVGNLKEPIVKEEQVLFAFNGLDENGDDKLTSAEWDKGLAEPEFYYWETTTTTTMPAADEAASAKKAAEEAAAKEAAAQRAAAKAAAEQEAAELKAAMARQQARQKAEREGPKAKIEKPPPAPVWEDDVSMNDLINRMGDAGKGSAQHALRSFDRDGDGIAAHGEFLAGLGKLPQPVKGPAAEGVFQSLDSNQDGMVESQEFANAFNRKRYVQANVQKSQGQSHMRSKNAQRETEVLKDMHLSQPPLTIAQFAQGMGSVTPETAFKALDADQNGEISETEMVRFASAFLPPLTAEQARYAQKGLDVNGDQRVVPQEMYDTLKFGAFFPTEDQAGLRCVCRRGSCGSFMVPVLGSIWGAGLKAPDHRYFDEQRQAFQNAMVLCCSTRPRARSASSSVKLAFANRTAADPKFVEPGLSTGSAAIARLNVSGQAQYIYGKVSSASPLSVLCWDGKSYNATDLMWVAAAKDDGWLAPYGKEWKEVGRRVFLRLLKNDEWVSAIVGTCKPEDAEDYLPLEGVADLPGVNVPEEVGMLFTPHEECQDEFAGLEPGRGGTLMDHLSKAFIVSGHKSVQRLRWVQKCRVEPQYPMRCVFVHPSVKNLGLAEFVRRCHEKQAECIGNLPDPEVVMLLGPPAAGKSSIQRLPPNEVPPALKETVRSLKYREEVNNDNLCDCMPGFRDQFKVALQVPKEYQAGGALWKKMMRLARSEPSESMALDEVVKNLRGHSDEHKSAIAWAMQWLTYAMFHHGPVRDSLAWDVIKVTIVDAPELSVYYSSVMAGAAIDRTMQILELAHSCAAPVAHAPLRVVGFWPCASQEVRHARQRHRHRQERDGERLLGGNVDANLVNLHFHAQQAESNISRMLKSLKLGQRPTDNGGAEAATEVQVDHFIVIDNDSPEPRILMNFTDQSQDRARERVKEEKVAARELLQVVDELPEWERFSCAVFRVAAFFLPADDDLIQKCASKCKDGKEALQEPESVLPVLQELDEAVFKVLTKGSPALHTSDMRPSFSRLESCSELSTMSVEQQTTLKEHLTDLRMLCVIKALRDEELDEEDESDDAAAGGDMQKDSPYNEKPKESKNSRFQIGKQCHGLEPCNGWADAGGVASPFRLCPVAGCRSAVIRRLGGGARLGMCCSEGPAGFLLVLQAHSTLVANDAAPPPPPTKKDDAAELFKQWTGNVVMADTGVAMPAAQIARAWLQMARSKGHGTIPSKSSFSSLVKPKRRVGSSSDLCGSITEGDESAGSPWEGPAEDAFHVQLERESTTEDWGFVWNQSALSTRRRFLLESVSEGSLAASWNSQERELGRCTLEPGSTLVEVNFLAGYGVIRHELNEATQLRLTFLRPAAASVLEKKLAGLPLECRVKNSFLEVAQVDADSQNEARHFSDPGPSAQKGCSSSAEGTGMSAADPQVCGYHTESEAVSDLIGTAALISGLMRSAEFNGKWCRIDAFDPEVRRYIVRVFLEDGQPPVIAKLRLENLVFGPAPSLAPVMPSTFQPAAPASASPCATSPSVPGEEALDPTSWSWGEWPWMPGMTSVAGVPAAADVDAWQVPADWAYAFAPPGLPPTEATMMQCLPALPVQPAQPPPQTPLCFLPTSSPQFANSETSAPSNFGAADASGSHEHPPQIHTHQVLEQHLIQQQLQAMQQSAAPDAQAEEELQEEDPAEGKKKRRRRRRGKRKGRGTKDQDAEDDAEESDAAEEPGLAREEGTLPSESQEAVLSQMQAEAPKDGLAAKAQAATLASLPLQESPGGSTRKPEESFQEEVEPALPPTCETATVELGGRGHDADEERLPAEGASTPQPTSRTTHRGGPGPAVSAWRPSLARSTDSSEVASRPLPAAQDIEDASPIDSKELQLETATWQPTLQRRTVQR